MITKTNRYPITQCALYKCKSKKKLAFFLNSSIPELREIQRTPEYHTFTIDKQNSTDKREISAPSAPLKKVQKRILKLLQRIERPDWLISGEKGKCYIDNGKAHQSSNHVLTMDIKKFYNNCHRESIYLFFKDVLQTSPDVATILTDITSYENMVPTGCPTSQLIAYYAYKDMFENLNMLAQNYCCKFTVYVDDLTFSSSNYFAYKALQRDVDICLRQFGHKPKLCKVKYYSPLVAKPITGTSVSAEHNLSVPNKLRFKIIKNLQLIKIELNPAQREKQRTSLLGQLQSARNIEATIFPEILRTVRSM